MDQTQLINDQLRALAAHLRQHRGQIMAAWRRSVAGDDELTTGTALPLPQLHDHLPDMLQAFEDYLVEAAVGGTHPSQNGQAWDDAAAHGLQRWQQGYDLREVAREFGHLHLCLIHEVERFAHSAAPCAGTLFAAQRALTRMCSEGVVESTAKYYQLQQAEALGQVRDLESALTQLNELEQQRAELWQQAAHDLRGNLGVVANATTGLSRDGLPESLRSNFLRMLTRNVSSLHALLNDVTQLARLQAGQEQRQVSTINAGELLHELCEALEAEAVARGLYLRTQGPVTLMVDGDLVKIRRVAQNLIHNAIKYTQRGGVTVGWGDCEAGDAERWQLTVTDTGPGFHTGSSAPLMAALEEATVESRLPHLALEVPSVPAEPPAPWATVAAPARQEPGEGIGLSIVKRLCSMLSASMALDSRIDEGTVIRVAFPRRYPS